MHILIISRSYPNNINQSSGNFVRNQVEALSTHPIQLGVLGVFNISLLSLKSFKHLGLLGRTKFDKQNLTYRFFLYPVIPKLHYLNSRIKLFIGKRLLRKYIKEQGKPHLIHIHTFEPGELVLWAKEKLGIPYLVTEHTTSFYTNKALHWHKSLAKRVYFNSSYNIAVSKASANDLKNRFNQDFQYLPNFVDTSKFKYKPKDTRPYKQFINIAYLDQKKNQKLLIHAFDKAFKNQSQYKLSIIGNGPEMDNLINEINVLGNQNIELKGYLPQGEIINQLQQSDYFVLSSNYETFGVVVIEAMSCGLPSISTKCGGPESIIINDKLGFLCNKNNIADLAESLIKIDRSQFDPIYIRGYANENFSYKVLSSKLISIYKSIIN